MSEQEILKGHYTTHYVLPLARHLRAEVGNLLELNVKLENHKDQVVIGAPEHSYQLKLVVTEAGLVGKRYIFKIAFSDNQQRCKYSQYLLSQEELQAFAALSFMDLRGPGLDLDVKLFDQVSVLVVQTVRERLQLVRASQGYNLAEQAKIIKTYERAGART